MRVPVTLTLEKEVYEASKPLIEQKRLSPVVNDLLKNLLLTGLISEENIIKVGKAKAANLEASAEKWRTEFYENATSNGVLNSWVEGLNTNQLNYWLDKIGFPNKEMALKYVQRRLDLNEASEEEEEEQPEKEADMLNNEHFGNAFVDCSSLIVEASVMQQGHSEYFYNFSVAIYSEHTHKLIHSMTWHGLKGEQVEQLKTVVGSAEFISNEEIERNAELDALEASEEEEAARE